MRYIFQMLSLIMIVSGIRIDLKQGYVILSNLFQIDLRIRPGAGGILADASR